MKALAVNFVGMNVADAFITLMLVDRGYTEGNPLWAAVIPESALLFVAMKALLALGAVGVLLHFKLRRALIACTAVMWAVVLWNAGLLLFS